MRYQLLGSGLLLLALGQAAHGQTVSPAADSAHVPGRRFTYTEHLPVFPAFEPADSTRPTMQRVVRFLQSDLHFPPKALRDGVQGKVLVSFVVDAEGRTTDIKIAKGLRDDVDAEVLRNARRLASIRWQPGTQNGRPVSVAFTAPISFSVRGGPTRYGAPGTDSLDLPQFNRLKLPSATWKLGKPLPASQGVIYGSCLQRMGFSSGGIAQLVRLVNLSTGQVFRIGVKPTMRSRRENTFCYALPAGRYALSTYEFNHSNVLLDFRAERLLKPSAGQAPGVAASRYVFTVVPGQLHYVGTWNFANENEPIFLDEKALLDATLQADYPAARLAEARVAIPH